MKAGEDEDSLAFQRELVALVAMDCSVTCLQTPLFMLEGRALPQGIRTLLQDCRRARENGDDDAKYLGERPIFVVAITMGVKGLLGQMPDAWGYGLQSYDALVDAVRELRQATRHSADRASAREREAEHIARAIFPDGLPSKPEQSR